jgi:tetratricopeptide (TPR) repeat protein
MRKKSIVFLITCFLFLMNVELFSAPALSGKPLKEDSLRVLLTQKLADTTRITIINNLAWLLRRSNIDTSIILNAQAFTLARKCAGSSESAIANAGLRGLASCYSNLGVFLEMKGSFDKALETDLKALDISKERKDKKGELNTLNNIGIVYWHWGKHARAIEYQMEALDIANNLKKLNKSDTLELKRDIALSMGNLGAIYEEKGDPFKALDYELKALKAEESDSNKIGIAINLGNIGVLYDNLGDYPKAIDYDLKALKVQEDINDKVGYALSLGNIGVICNHQRDTTRALEYYQKALKLDDELGNKSEVGRMLINCASVFYDERKYSKALEYDTKALKMTEEMHNLHMMPYCLRGIGNVYEAEGDSALEKGNTQYANTIRFAMAHQYYQRALDISMETGERSAIAFSYGNIGSVEMKVKNYKEAEKDLLIAVGIFDSLGELSRLANNYATLSDLYEREGRLKDALVEFRKYTTLNDSVNSIEKNKEVTRLELNYEFAKMEAERKTIEDRKDLQVSEDKRRNRVVLYAGSVVMLLIISIGALIYRNNVQKQKANTLLERKNKVIEHQKEVVEEQNKHIMDSIQYAKRIQDAILPVDLFLEGEVMDHFIFFAPKDVVSGDFYWRHDAGAELYFAVVDCTGHGVPGAMMSMMGYDVLESALKDKGLVEPAQILKEVNNQVVEKLITSNPGGTRDGMDMTLCRLNKKTGVLTYAGAKNELWIASGSEIICYPVDKVSIGDRPGIQFSQHRVSLKHNEVVYLFTDGYADQKGGVNKRKFMRSQFRKLLTSVSSLECDAQKSKLEGEFYSWKGDVLQRDDVLVVGFRAENRG